MGTTTVRSSRWIIVWLSQQEPVNVMTSIETVANEMTRPISYQNWVRFGHEIELASPQTIIQGICLRLAILVANDVWVTSATVFPRALLILFRFAKRTQKMEKRASDKRRREKKCSSMMRCYSKTSAAASQQRWINVKWTIIFGWKQSKLPNWGKPSKTKTLSREMASAFMRFARCASGEQRREQPELPQDFIHLND